MDRLLFPYAVPTPSLFMLATLNSTPSMQCCLTHDWDSYLVMGFVPVKMSHGATNKMTPFDDVHGLCVCGCIHRKREFIEVAENSTVAAMGGLRPKHLPCFSCLYSI